MSSFRAHICGRPPLRVLWVMKRSAGCFKWRAECSTGFKMLCLSKKVAGLKHALTHPFDIRHCMNIVHRLSEHPSVCFTGEL